MSELNYARLKSELTKKNTANMYLLTGEEYITGYFEKSIIKATLGENFNDFNLSIFNSENINLEHLEASIETLPVISEKKCVIARNISWGELEEKYFFQFVSGLKNTPEFTVLIIIQNSEPSGAKNKKAFKALQKEIVANGVSARFSQNDIPLEKLLILWAKKEYGKVLSAKHAKLLQNLCKNQSLTAIKSELEKICESEKSDTITETAFNAVCASLEESKVFDLPKFIFAGNTKKALEILENLLRQKEDPIAITAIIGSEYIDLYRAKIFSDNKQNSAELCDIFNYKGKEFRIKNALRRCQSISIKQITNALNLILDTDLKLKSTSLSPKTVLTELVVKLSGVFK